MAGESPEARDRQKELAKEYGLNEDIFSKEVVDKLLSDNRKGKWTPEAEEFMQKWDWKTAEEAFRNMKKASEQASKVDPKNAAADNTSIEKARMKERMRAEDVRKMEFEAEQDASDPDKPSYAYTQGDETMAFSKDWKEKKYENVKSVEISSGEKPKLIRERIDEITQPELRQIVADFWTHRDMVEVERAKKGSRFTSLANTLTLGLRRNKINDDAEIINFEKESQNRYRDLIAAGIKMYANDKIQLKNFLDQYGDPNKIFCETHDAELGKRAKFGFPENILAGFYKIGKRWSELKPWQKFVYGAAAGSLVAGGALFVGAGTFGAAALTAGYRWGFRGFGAMAMGIGKKISLETERKKEMDSESEKVVDEMMMVLGQFENNIDMGIAVVLDGKKSIADIRKNYEETSKKNTKKALWLTGKTFIISSIVGEGLRLGGQYTGINIGTILKKIGDYTGLNKAVGSFAWPWQVGAVGGTVGHHANEALVSHAPEVKTGGGLMGYGTEADGHNFVDSHPEGKYGPVGYGTEGEGHDLVDAHPEGKYGSGLYGSEGEGHNVVQAHPEGKYGSVGYGTEGEGHVADMREVASGKFGSGGSIERASNNVLRAIKANPAQYGLDSHDPNFSEHANDLREKMIEEFYTKKGFASYKDFDAYARNHVQPKDLFKIDYDPEAEKFHMNYEGKAFGADVSHGSAAQEVVSSKPPASPAGGQQMAVEEMKPKTGVADHHQHQSSKGGGKTMQYEADTPDQKIAKDDFAKADQYQKDVRFFNAKEAVRLEGVNETADNQLFSSTKEGIENIFHESGIGIRANILDQPMNEWGKLVATENYIAQDVQGADAVGKTNINLNKLKYLRLILGRYNASGSETIGECLKQAVKDPKVLYLINKSVL